MTSESTKLSVHSDSTTSSHRPFVEQSLTAVKRVKEALLFSSTYLVVIAMAEVVTVMFALSLEPNPAPVVVGLVTFAVYMGDRISDVDTDELSNPTQSAFVRRHETALSVLSAVSYGVAVAISVFGGPIALGITLLPGVFWVLYASEWLPEVGFYVRRLKEVLVLNSAVVALGWAVTLTFLPLTFAGRGFTMTGVVIFVYFFLDSFVNTEIPNVNDREADEEIGVSTLPVVFGVRRTRQFVYAVDLSLIGLVALAYLDGVLSTAMAAALLGGLGYALGVATFVGRTERHSRLAVAGETKSLVVVALFAALTLVGI
jgi:4-hydroxybenzoate polyprenyltransferase